MKQFENNYLIIAYSENLDMFENILMYSQYMIRLLTNVILFTYKKSPTS